MTEFIESKDIQKTPKKENKQKETLDQILQSKITDETTADKAKPILEQVQQNFQNPINDYLKKIDTDFLIFIIDTETDPIKFLIEDIKKTTDNMEKVIDVTENKTIDQIEKKTENKIIKQKEKIDILNSRKNTKESYDKLDKTKYPEPTAEEISQ